ncbi:MAG: hypothetical protein U0270_34485 [Labilithrix sp.]
MGRRHHAEELFEDEYQEEERTRAAVSVVPSYDDQFEDRTRSARESQLALEGLARSAERARAAFVAPAELEGERSPAMRARRQSFVDASELLPTPHRPSYVAPSERSERRSRVERVERNDRSDRSERASIAPGPVPAPPTPRGSRFSFVASSERADFASSAPDAEEVTNYRPLSAPPSQRASQHPASSRRASQHPVRESTYAPTIESSEIEEIPSAKRASAPAPEEQSRPVDYEALKRYLFDDVPAGSPEAAAMSPEDRSVSMQTPIATLAPRATNKAFRPAMHSIRPEIAPAARISHHAFRPQMMTGPQLPAMNAPVAQDSYVDSSWIVPTPAFANAAQAGERGSLKITLSFIAAAMTAVAALSVMIGAILFIRSEDPAPTFTPAAQLPAAAPVEVAKQPEPAKTVTPAVVVQPTPATPATPVASAADKSTKKVVEKIAVEKTETPKKKKSAPAAQSDEDDDAPPPPPKKKKTASDKSVEALLADLQEQQLNR